jgi:septum formation protein
LASTSATRSAILRRAGVDFTPQAPPIDEDALKAQLQRTPHEDWAMALARGKALSIISEDLVLGADQTLLFGNEIIHKPASIGAARQQLIKLRGRTHRLKTAVIIAKNGSIVWACAQDATLHMRNFTDTFLDDYLEIEGPDIFTSAGGYKIEKRGAQLFTNIEGDHFTILGLPLWPLLDFLRTEAVLIT